MRLRKEPLAWPTRRERGFTLIELMVVVAVIIVVAALILPRYLDVTDRAKYARCRGNIGVMNSAAAVYLAWHLTTAASLDELVTAGCLQVVPECPFGVVYGFDGYSITNVDDHEHVR